MQRPSDRFLFRNQLSGDLFSHAFLERTVQRIQEFIRGEVMIRGHVFPVNKQGEILCHLSSLNGLNADILQSFTEFNEFLIAIKFASECKSAGPSENAGDGVCTCRFSLLVLAEVTGNSSVRGFGFHRLSVRGYQC